MSERDEPKDKTGVGFRAREVDQKSDFTAALKKQTHIANATLFFQSVMDAVIKASSKKEVLEWPIKFVTKPKE